MKHAVLNRAPIGESTDQGSSGLGSQPHATNSSGTLHVCLALQLLAPAPPCPALADPGATSGTVSDGAAPGGNYSANSNCSWTVLTPDAPYISATFSRLSTEPGYDTVTVEDMGEVLGVYSGGLPPSGSLTTDTGEELADCLFASHRGAAMEVFSLGCLIYASSRCAVPWARPRDVRRPASHHFRQRHKHPGRRVLPELHSFGQPAAQSAAVPGRAAAGARSASHA